VLNTNFLNSPCIAAAFVVNSEPQAGARPSVRLCVRLELARCVNIPIYTTFLFKPNFKRFECFLAGLIGPIGNPNRPYHPSIAPRGGGGLENPAETKKKKKEWPNWAVSGVM
jgi:hypothetical protein